jgi:hypothetical protein
MTKDITFVTGKTLHLAHNIRSVHKPEHVAKKCLSPIDIRGQSSSHVSVPFQHGSVVNKEANCSGNS